MKRMITAVLTVILFVAGVADAAYRCCAVTPDSHCAASSLGNRAGAREDARREVPSPCHAGRTAIPEAPNPDHDERAACCTVVPCGASTPDEFLWNPSPPSAALQSTISLSPDLPAGPAFRMLPTERIILPPIPLYLLHHAILR